ncbi:MAG TPA: hypothetical protein VHF22_12535 [Planctomycetota bacterium]|nr:hypothetical protein [Planctomycetota bacterium]
MRRLLAALSFTLLATAFAGCSIERLELKADAPPAKPLPAALAARFAYDASAPVKPALEKLDETDTFVKFRGVYDGQGAGAAAGEGSKPSGSPAVASSGAPVTFEYWRSKLGGDGPRPVVLVVPILAGNYPECDHLGRLMARNGMHCFFVHREDNILALEKDRSEPFEQKLRRSIVNIRRTLDWACAQPEVDRAKVGLVGISMGAISGSIVMAVEPRIRAGVLIMGGGDLPGIICDSIETPVRRYKVHRMRDNDWTEAQFRADVRRQLQSDPLDFAPFVGAARVQQYISLYDNKVPTVYQWKLWKALGGPEGFAIPIGHYTSIFYLPFAERNAMAFMKKRLGVTDLPPEAPDAAAAKVASASSSK